MLTLEVAPALRMALSEPKVPIFPRTDNVITHEKSFILDRKTVTESNRKGSGLITVGVTLIKKSGLGSPDPATGKLALYPPIDDWVDGFLSSGVNTSTKDNENVRSKMKMPATRF